MKFILPKTPPAEQFLSGIGTLKTTWEFVLASGAVITQSVIGIAYILLSWKRLPPLVPLWYIKPWGHDRLASPWFLFLPLALSLVIYAVNIQLIRQFCSDHPLFGRVLLLVSAVTSTLSLILVIQIIQLVG